MVLCLLEERPVCLWAFDLRLRRVAQQGVWVGIQERALVLGVQADVLVP